MSNSEDTELTAADLDQHCLHLQLHKSIMLANIKHQKSICHFDSVLRVNIVHLMTPCANKNLGWLEYNLISDSIQLNGFLSYAYSTKKTRLLESHCLFK